MSRLLCCPATPFYIPQLLMPSTMPCKNFLEMFLCLETLQYHNGFLFQPLSEVVFVRQNQKMYVKNSILICEPQVPKRVVTCEVQF